MSHGLSYLTRSPSLLTLLDPLARQLLARDRFGNPRLEGGDSFHVRIEGPSIPHERRLLDLGTGEYELYLLLPVSGEYRVHVSLDGSPLRGSPTTVEVVTTSHAHAGGETRGVSPPRRLAASPRVGGRTDRGGEGGCVVDDSRRASGRSQQRRRACMS